MVSIVVYGCHVDVIMVALWLWPPCGRVVVVVVAVAVSMTAV